MHGNLCRNKMHYSQLLINIAPTYSTLIYEHILPLGLLGRDFTTQSKHIFVFPLEKSINSYIYIHSYNSGYSHHHNKLYLQLMSKTVNCLLITVWQGACLTFDCVILKQGSWPSLSQSLLLRINSGKESTLLQLCPFCIGHVIS